MAYFATAIIVENRTILLSIIDDFLIYRHFQERFPFDEQKRRRFSPALFQKIESKLSIDRTTSQYQTLKSNFISLRPSINVQNTQIPKDDSLSIPSTAKLSFSAPVYSNSATTRNDKELLSFEKNNPISITAFKLDNSF